MSIHDGHRDRVRKRFLAEGLDQFSDIQVLEFLLFYCFSRQDTNPLAHALLDRFGSISQVLDAPVEELEKVEGIGHNTAVFLKMVPQVGRYYLKDRASKVSILPTLDACRQYLHTHFYGQRVEMVYLLCLDAKCKVLCCRKIAEGSLTSTQLPVRKIVEIALTSNAASIVLGHNHPGGLAIPSSEDYRSTRHLMQALQAVDVQLLDHIVCAEDDYVSIFQSRIWQKSEEMQGENYGSF